MPYKIERYKKGYAVIDPNTSHVFSKQGLSKSRATKQRIALAISSSKKENKPIKNYFI